MKRSVLVAIVFAGLILAANSWVWAEKSGEVLAKEEKASEFLVQAKNAYKAKDYEQAVKYYSEALKVNPKLTKARYERGLAYYCLEKYDEAESDFLRVTLKNPRNHKAAYYLGITYWKTGRYDLALNEFEKANQISPRAKYAQAINSLKGRKKGLRQRYALEPGRTSDSHDFDYEPDDPVKRLPAVEFDEHYQSGRRVPTTLSLDRLFGHCYDNKLDVRRALTYLRDLGILPYKAPVGGGDRLTLRIYRTCDQSGKFYVAHDRRGRIHRWGTY